MSNMFVFVTKYEGESPLFGWRHDQGPPISEGYDEIFCCILIEHILPVYLDKGLAMVLYLAMHKMHGRQVNRNKTIGESLGSEVFL